MLYGIIIDTCKKTLSKMTRNYFLMALRALAGNKTTTIINIIGLASGLAAAILIMMYVVSELKTDRFNEKYHQIHRVDLGEFPVMGAGIAGLFNDVYPEIEEAVRFSFGFSPVLRYNGNDIKAENFVFADSTLNRVFTIEFLQGDPKNALSRPYSLVLTRSAAESMFGTEDPAGRTVRFNNLHDFTVTGVIEDFGNSHISIDYLTSFSTLPEMSNDPHFDEHLFRNMNYPTYFILSEEADPSELASAMNSQIEKEFPDLYTSNPAFRFSLKNLHSVYFDRDSQSGYSKTGNLPLVWMLTAVALFIILIASFNYINLSTASAGSRAKEIGIRKLLGAGRKMIIFQFLAESVMLCLAAFIVAIVFVELFIPVFNNMVSANFTADLLTRPATLLISLGGVILTGILAGIYPAFYLSSFAPASILKGEKTKGKGAVNFRRFFIVLQFSITAILIIGTLIANSQVNFLKNKDLGFNNEKVITLRLNREILRNADAFREALLGYPEIEKYSMSNNIPGYVGWFEGWLIDEEIKQFKFMSVDPDYLDLMEIELSEGRGFSWERLSDMDNAFIINEEAVRYFGFDSPSGKEFDVGIGKPARILGVVKDFHFRSLHEPIGPFVMDWNPDNLRVANIRISGKNIPGTMEFIKKEWGKFSPSFPFEYAFLEDETKRLYRAETSITTLFSSFAILAIIIACLGLYGLASFVANQKTKEIGIRKAMGASVSSVMLMLSAEFAKWVIISNIIAWPVAYIIASRWLENFPYRISPGAGIFILAGIIALVIAVVTVAGQSYRTANLNPAVTLRDE